MITVLRRWFVPSAQLEQFAQKWRSEVLPELRSQPGCVRVEVYESSIRDHWVTAISWQDHESRSKAIEKLTRYFTEFAPYERFEPEILTLRADDADDASAPRA
jgi:quinol monooxygenase YgiN